MDQLGLRGFVLSVLGLAASTALATIFHVTNTNDSGAGSLRAAISSANSNPGADAIVFDAGVTGKITLTTGQITITGPVTITGPGSALLTVSGNANDRVIFIDDGNDLADSPVTITGLTLAEGYTGDCTGAQVLNSGGALGTRESLTLQDVVMRDSFASSNGGGFAFLPTKAGQALTIQDAVVINNRAGCSSATSNASAGGLHIALDAAAPVTASATVLIKNTRVEGNVAVRHGGGVRVTTPGTTTLQDVAVRGNSASIGGGIFVVYSGTAGMPLPNVTILTSEISYNNAASTGVGGGGVVADNDRDDAQTPTTDIKLTVRDSTISGNQARNGPGGGISVYGNVTLLVQNSTIAYNMSAQALAAPSEAGGVYRQIGVQAAPGVGANREGTVTLGSTIVANNLGTIGPEDVGQSAETFANAITANKSLLRAVGSLSPALAGAGNILNQDPRLLALTNNGGPTATHALGSGSPAINAGANPVPLTTDQRGLPRVVGAAADIGAFESGNVIPLGCVDVDGNGVADALTDGLVLVRAMFGLTGTSATNGAIGPNASRATWTLIRAYLNGNCGSSFGP